MTGAYGPMLDAFPELMRSVRTWTQIPKLGGGYEAEKAIKYISAIVLEDKGSDTYKKKMGDFSTLDISDSDIMYVMSDDQLEVGQFVTHPDNGLTYRLVKKMNYSHVVGHDAWKIERIQGSVDDTPQEIQGGVF